MIMFLVMTDLWEHNGIATTKSDKARNSSSKIIGQGVKKHGQIT